MWNTIESLAITLAISLLKAILHSPAQAKLEGKIIAQVAAAATQADEIANGTVWTSQPATDPAPAS